MSIFDRTPPPEPPGEEMHPWEPQKPWFGRPEFERGAVLPLSAFLVRTRTVVIELTSLTAFPAGCALTIRWGVRRADETASEWRARVAATRRDVFSGRVDVTDTALELAVAFDDGATTTTSAFKGHLWDEETVDKPVLIRRESSSGGGGTDRLSGEHTIWLYPLPPGDHLTLAVRWLALGIDETSITLDAAAIRAAAAQSEHYWPEDATLG